MSNNNMRMTLYQNQEGLVLVPLTVKAVVYLSGLDR